MNRIIKLFSLMLVLVLAACSSDEVRVENPEQDFTSNLRSADEAVALAKNLYQSRHNSRADVAVANVAVIGSSASRAAADTLIYAVNFADNQGCTLVSAAKAGEAIIGYSDEGQYSEEEVAENSNFSYYMEAAKDYVEANAVIGPIDPTPDPSAPIKEIERIQPRVTVNYGQKYPEGELFSNGLAGCAQTAVAMVCSFVEWPIIMYYSCNDVSISSEILNWSEIKKHVTSVNFFALNGVPSHQCTASSEVHDVLARLCREIGYLSNADSSNKNQTTTEVSNMINTIKKIASTSSFITVSNIYNFSKSEMYENLKSGDCVLCVIGYSDADSDIAKAHVWICDGGEKQTITSKALLANGEWEIRVDYAYYNHFNWGKCGSQNGYFYDGVFEYTELLTPYDYKYNVQYVKINK